MRRFEDVIMLENEAALALELDDREVVTAVYAQVQRARVGVLQGVIHALPGSIEMAAAKTRRDRLQRLSSVLRARLDTYRDREAPTLPPPPEASAALESERRLLAAIVRDAS